MIETKNLTKIYGKNKTEVVALKNISILINKGDFVAIKGPSGSGKSTLLNLLGCLEKPTSGDLSLNGLRVSNLNDSKLAMLRRQHIGFIFQSYNLIPTLNAFENISLPMMFDNQKSSVISARTNELLDLVGMKKRAQHKPSELSGGEQQRIAIARALCNNPALIIGDEPTGNLDSKTGSVIIDLLQELNEKNHTILLVTHDETIANTASRVIRIKDGLLENPKKITERK
ncbi:MAG: ABC transporter ATP-binding protein [Alkaliphilus sp.]